MAFLGHVISAAGIAVNLKKIEAIRNWPKPMSIAKIQSFLGLTSYYRQFVIGQLPILPES